MIDISKLKHSGNTPCGAVDECLVVYDGNNMVQSTGSYHPGNDYKVTDIFIETALKKFIPGRSRADTIMKLAKFNGIVSWMCYENFDIQPTYINVNSARSLYGLSFPRGTKGPKRKKMVIEAVIEKEKTAFTYEMARGGKNYKKGTDDRADEVVIARAGEFLLRNKKLFPFLLH